MIESGTILIHRSGAYYEFVCTATWSKDGDTPCQIGIYQSCEADKGLHVFARPMTEFFDLVDLNNGLLVQRFTEATAEKKICRGCGDWTLTICGTCKISTCENCAGYHLRDAHDWEYGII